MIPLMSPARTGGREHSTPPQSAADLLLVVNLSGLRWLGVGDANGELSGALDQPFDWQVLDRVDLDRQVEDVGEDLRIYPPRPWSRCACEWPDMGRYRLARLYI